MMCRRLMCLVLVLLLFLTGCGSNATPPTASNTTTVTAGDDTTVVSHDGTTLPAETNVTVIGGGEVTTSVRVTDNGAVTTKTVSATTTEAEKTTTTKGGVILQPPHGNKQPTKTTTGTRAVGAPLEQGLNFGGKSYTYVGVLDPAFLADEIKGFEKAYNAKIGYSKLSADVYLDKVVSAQLGGKPYDIITYFGALRPEALICQMFEEVSDYVLTGTPSEPDFEGKKAFSLSLSYENAYRSDEIYIFGGKFLQTPTVLIYNKDMWKQAGLEDPHTLVASDKWSWSKAYEQLMAVTDAEKSVYGINDLVGNYTQQFAVTMDTDIVKRNMTGRHVNNLSDATLYKMYEILQNFYGKSGRSIVTPKADGNELELFLGGEIASVFTSSDIAVALFEVLAATDGGDELAKSIGVVRSPTGWNYVATFGEFAPLWDWVGFAAGYGCSDPRVALAYAKWDAAAQYQAFKACALPAETKRDLESLLADITRQEAPINGFSGAAGSLDSLVKTLSQKIVVEKQNPTTMLNSYKKPIETLLKAEQGI